jgi:hypothetical protein
VSPPAINAVETNTAAGLAYSRLSKEFSDGRASFFAAQLEHRRSRAQGQYPATQRGCFYVSALTMT